MQIDVISECFFIKFFDILYLKFRTKIYSSYKRQSEHEVKGGHLLITLSEAADNNLYLWAKKSTLLRDGQVLFQTDIGISVLRINFSNAYCINLSRDINTSTGTTTTLIIAPETVDINGVTHKNFWPK